MELARGSKIFYDRYHQKNQPFKGVIRDGNFTYYYWQKILTKHLPSLAGLHILDVGCGVGSLSLYCASKNARVTGIDISKRAITIATSAATSNIFAYPPAFHCQQLEDTAGLFDVVICSEVIEHVPDEKIFIKQLISHLKPSGLLLLSTPNSQNWLRQSGRLQAFDNSVGHVRLFNPATLKSLVAPTPTTLVDFQLTEGPIRMWLFSSRAGNLIRFLKGPLVPLFHAIDHVLAQLLGWHDQFIVLKKDG